MIFECCDHVPLIVNAFVSLYSSLTIVPSSLLLQIEFSTQLQKISKKYSGLGMFLQNIRFYLSQMCVSDIILFNRFPFKRWKLIRAQNSTAVSKNQFKSYFSHAKMQSSSMLTVSLVPGLHIVIIKASQSSTRGDWYSCAEGRTRSSFCSERIYY